MVGKEFEGVVQSMADLSQEYALGKLARQTLNKKLNHLSRELDTILASESVRDERKKAFYQGFLVGVLFLLTFWVLIKFYHAFASPSYWG